MPNDDLKSRGSTLAFYRMRAKRRKRGVALIMVLGSLTLLSLLAMDVQEDASLEIGSILAERDALKAEYAARSGVNLTRLLIATEPTIRRTIDPFMKMMTSFTKGAAQVPTQLPVWEFAPIVLEPFMRPRPKDAPPVDASSFSMNSPWGMNLGLDGVGFTIDVIDEDAKININASGTGNAIRQESLAGALLGLMKGTQYNKLFEKQDPDGQYSDRRVICGAIVDWSDPDIDGYACNPKSGQAPSSGPEDSVYQLFKDPYKRKNAPFDSIEELRLVRGISDDFWATFVQPEAGQERSRTMTVWGQGKININTANGMTLLAALCNQAVPEEPLCNDRIKAQTFLTTVEFAKSMLGGMPIFSSPAQLIEAMQGKGTIGEQLKKFGIMPMKFLTNNAGDAFGSESKVFSVISTGQVQAGKRHARLRMHAVVDFRDAPKPGEVPDPTKAAGANGSASTPTGTQAGPPPGMKAVPGAGPGALYRALTPSAAGTLIYYKTY